MTNGNVNPATERGSSSYNNSGTEISHESLSTNWAGNVSFGAAHVYKPESIDDLRRIVSGSRQIRALGNVHSFSGITDTTDDLVLLNSLPKTFKIDSAHSSVTVDAGTSYTELAVALHRAGLALANMASIPNISIAGACATGTHGSGDNQRVLAASVAAMQIVGSDGDIVELRRDLEQDHFQGSVVALGALGIVTQLTLDVEPTYEMSQRAHLGVSLDEIQDHLDDVFSAGYSVSAFTDWHSGEAGVLVKHRLDQPASTLVIGRKAEHTVHPVPGRPTDVCTEQLGVVGPWHERLPHFRANATRGTGHELQSEVFVPRNVADQAIPALREIGSLLTPALLISEIRTVRADDLWLSPAYGRDSIAFHFTWTDNDPAVMDALAALEERLMPLDPRPHWGKLSSMTAAQVIASYERAPDFNQLMVEHDPTFKFRNDFVNGLFPIL